MLEPDHPCAQGNVGSARAVVCNARRIIPERGERGLSPIPTCVLCTRIIPARRGTWSARSTRVAVHPCARGTWEVGRRNASAGKGSSLRAGNVGE